MKQVSRLKQLFNKIKPPLLLLVSIIAFSFKATAQFDEGITDPYNGAVIGFTSTLGTIDLVNGATAIVTCPAGSSSEVVSSRKIINIIRLVLNEETSKYLSTDFAATVTIKIEYGADVSSLSQLTRDFSVSYNKAEGVKYNAKNYMSFEGAKYVKITIMNITPPSAGGVNMKDILYVENQMQITRYYELQSGISPVITAPTQATNPIDALPVSWTWPANTGNNATQLEWTWLEDELAPNYYLPNSTNIDIEKLFTDNATRIDLPYDKNSFNIPLFYDGIGKLYFRIRPVNIKADGSRRDGNWTIPNTSIGICSYNGHNNDLNWQVRSSFAEEGKMKSVMEYYDGSLRSRQTVTKENVNNTTVTAETFYDYEGRPSIQILPTPGINNIIKYQANLNLFNGQSQNQDPAQFFDLHLNSATGSDLYATPGLSGISGSSRYYSASNDELNTGANKYIPDAEQYPYTVTRYTPDGTGRIMAQSGVGPTHKMGTGKETKYYYGSAGQEELDGLFGTEVGYSSHYFKNMVKDANGQMSVSYTDMHGRTVATALAGESPDNLIALDNQNSISITRNLLDKNTNLVKNNAIESVNTILVPASTAYTFQYQLTPENLSLNACNNTPICYECLYDLEFSITDESGEQSPFVYTYKNLTVSGAVDDNCSTQNPFIEVCAGCPVPVNNVITIVKTLAPGSYSIRKTLTLSESSLQKYKDLFFQQGKGLCKTEQEIIDSVYTVLHTASNCDAVAPPECETCLNELGNFSTFRSNYLSSIGNPNPVSSTLEAEILAAFNEESKKCASICNTTSQLINSKRQLMLADMMPYGGQYATQTPPGTGTSMFNKYNIFSTAFNGSTQPYFKKPKAANGNFDFYRNNLGEIDIQIHPDGTLNLLNTTTPDDFTNQFVSDWANALLPYHPEYQRLLYAENTLGPANVYNWINTFNNTETYAAASTAGYIMTSLATINDPFYTTAPSYKSTMNGWITTNYAGSNLSMWQMARGAVKCKNVSDPGACFANSGTLVPPFADLTTTEEKDQMWLAFRGLYAAARDEQVNQYINQQVPVADDAALVAQGYQLRFGTNTQTVTQIGATWFPQNIGGPPIGIPTGGVPASNITDSYTSSCQSYIDQWKQSLLQCNALASLSQATRDQILNEITAGMTTVCIKGSDASNSHGSSTVKPSTPVDGSPRSFEEVINQVFASHSISKDYYCNPYVIEFPKPYGNNPVFAKEITTVVDSCGCANFSNLSALATTAGYNPSVLSSINTFLQQQYQDTLTPVLHQALLNCSQYKSLVCTTQANCNIPTTCQEVFAPNYLSSAQPLPEFLKCGFIPKECLTCDKLDDLTTEFKTIFGIPYNGGPVFTATDLTPEQINQNILFSRFLNFRMGFQYSWMQYSLAIAAATCSAGGSGVTDLEVTSRTGNTPLQYIASNSITFLPEFTSGVNDEFETLLQPNAGEGSDVIICADNKPLNEAGDLFAIDPPCKRMQTLSVLMGQNIFQQRLLTMQSDFEKQYREKCMAAKNLESFTVTYSNKEYHYTLYYYDMAGSLVKTVPPKGVIPNYTPAFLTSIKTARDNCRDNDNCAIPAITPSHTLVTQYRYNSLGQVIAQNSPDANTSKFWYDRLGRLVVSQNAQQAAEYKYSYTLYDALGRITEVGQKPQTTLMSQTISQDDAALNAWIVTNGSTREQITYTVYDLQYLFNPPNPPGLYPLLTQQNLRNRVSYSATKNLATDAMQYTASFYTYDIHGNVDTLLQDYNGVTEMQSSSNRFKMMTYNYDLISGKVNMVSYQPDWYNAVTQLWERPADKFFHKYKYDAENRLTEVWTSRDKIEWERDAAYNYYKYGPLSRTVLGQLQVQGIDYAYTIQGWLKGVNGTNSPTGGAGGGFDMGADGITTGTNSKVARDIYGFALHYFDYGDIEVGNIDYKAIGAASLFARPDNGAFVSLYNGNIAAMSVNNAGLLKGPASITNALPLFYNYRYDQLNRIKSMNAFSGLNTATNQWQPVAINDYAETISYDPNGNILSYNRNGSPSIAGKQQSMDALGYVYNTGNNQLRQVTDNTGYTSNYTSDIDNQTNTNNYTYDAIGNLKTDAAENITSTNWTVYGKISSITKNGSTISYTYDASGNRITKTIPPSGGGGAKTTIYVRDASGNVMTIYEKPAATAIEQTEINLYGSSRLGVLNKLTVPVTTAALNGGYGTAYISTFTRGEKNYELTNHLGNVMETISDRKNATDNNTDGTIDYYTADVITAADYYPFGMKMPGRIYPSSEVVPPAGGGTAGSPVKLYEHKFQGTFSTPLYYNGSATYLTLSSYLSNVGWTNSQNGWQNMTGADGTQNSCIGISSASPTTTTLTLTLNVQSGYNVSFTSFSFDQKSGSNGYTNWSMAINGISVGSGTLTPGGGNNFQFTGLLNVANAVNGLTGTITAVITLSGGNHSSNASYRIDNFILNGYVQNVASGGGGGSTTNGYRYGFNGKEEDDEVKGDGNQQDYGMRIYDPRLGRFLSVDPITDDYPELTPYQFASNRPIQGADLDGLEFEDKAAMKKGLEELRQEQAALKQEQAAEIAWKTYQNSKRTPLGWLWKGAKDSYQETIKSVSKESLSNTWNNLKGTASDLGNMLVAKPGAAESFSSRVSNFSKGVSNSITQPIIFFGTMNTRSLNENMYGLGYYGFQFATVYAMDGFVGDLTAGANVGTRILGPYRAKTIKVTEASIAKALEGSTMKTIQGSISLPMVQRYVKMLEDGFIAPPINVADGVIIEGNHRYVAGRIFGAEPSSVPGTLPTSQASQVKPIQQIKVDPVDWDPPKN